MQIVTKVKHSHLVAIIKGPSDNRCRSSSDVPLVPEAEIRGTQSSPWFVFNDFVVRNISEEEALSFPDKWKVGSICT